MSNTLSELARFYEVCQNAAKYLDPEERAKCVAEWLGKQPPHVQRLAMDAMPVIQNIGKRIAERRVPRMPGGSNG
jgi:hypothetical protein